ncbi:TadE family protein [Zobellella sp. DQSA1]|uniref:TadE family protein n=1 Tax=Zobellella sp. DQSA1 TaxID=3342386 RepID=UPI0035BFF25E
MSVQVSRQSGTTTVEFAIVGAVVFLVLFAVMEVGRLMYTWNLLNEASRRAARLAAVCLVDEGVNGAVAGMVVDEVGGSLPGFTPANITLEYLDRNSGTALADPAGVDYGSIFYVRSRIANYRYEMVLPLTVDLSMFAPDFATTLRSENLGRIRTADHGGLSEAPCVGS